MANNYESGATCVPADCFAPGGAEAAVLINNELQDILQMDDRPEAFDDFYAGGLNLEAGDDGSLYIASGDEYFCSPSFEYLIQELAERKLLLKSFGLSIAFYCSKLRPDEHGGVYYRALPNGEVLVISTQLDDLTDEQFRYLTGVRFDPAPVLDQIAQLLSGQDWEPELLCQIAGLVRSTGRIVDDIY